MKGVYIFLADGFEDMEALSTRDVLKRGGVDVETVSITEDYTVESSHGVTVFADMNFEEFKQISDEGTGREDVLIFPGGMPGTKNLADNFDLMEMMKYHYDSSLRNCYGWRVRSLPASRDSRSR